MRTLLRKIKNWKFKSVFYFYPTSEDDPSHYMEQHLVDVQLACLAANYRMDDNEERLLRKQFDIAASREGTAREGLLRAGEELLYARRALHLAKGAFWRAHELAKKKGFSVKEKYSDYLTGT